MDDDTQNVAFIGVLDSIYKKLSEEERGLLLSIIKEGTHSKRELEQTQRTLVQTQMFLAVIVKEHGVRSADDARAILRLHKDAFGHIKGDLESWEEPAHMVLSYRDESAERDEEGLSARSRPDSDERSPN